MIIVLLVRSRAKVIVITGFALFVPPSSTGLLRLLLPVLCILTHSLLSIQLMCPVRVLQLVSNMRFGKTVWSSNIDYPVEKLVCQFDTQNSVVHCILKKLQLELLDVCQRAILESVGQNLKDACVLYFKLQCQRQIFI